MAVTILSADNIEDLKQIVKDRTAEDRTKLIADAPKTTEPAQVAKIRTLLEKSELRSHCKGIEDILTELVSLVTNETYSFKKDDDGIRYNYRKYTMVVPTEKVDPSIYAANQPFLVLLKVRENGAATASMQGGDEGRGNTHKGKWRLATDEEIDTFFAGLSATSQAELLTAFQE